MHTHTGGISYLKRSSLDGCHPLVRVMDDFWAAMPSVDRYWAQTHTIEVKGTCCVGACMYACVCA